MLDLEEKCLELSQHVGCVAIDRERINRLGATLRADPPNLPAWEAPIMPADPDRVAVASWLANAINFSYWVSAHHVPWSFRREGVVFEGALGVFAVFTQALDEGIDLAHGPTLDGYAAALIDAGEGVLPLGDERIAALREIATIVQLQFAGRLEHAIAAASTDAPTMATFLAETFPSFRDTRTFRGVELPFLKRAQLAAGMLHAARVSRGVPGLQRAERLTVYADYMLPRTLRHLGVLRYAASLAARIDGQRPIDPGTEEEIALRVTTVAAGALLRREAQISALELDYWLWRRGFDASRPYHRTRCTDY